VTEQQMDEQDSKRSLADLVSDWMTPILSGLTVVLVVALVVWRGKGISDTLLIAIIVTVPTLFTSIASLRQSKRNAKRLEMVAEGIDGRQQELMEAQKALALHLGFETGKKVGASMAEGKTRRVTDPVVPMPPSEGSKE
jgi:Flp pilus assembly protein TadB